MQERTLSASQIQDYAQHLIGEERAPATVEKYLRDIRAFLAWTARRPVTRELGGQWKNELLDSGLAPATVNAKLSALNSLFRFLGWDECRVRFLKVQRQVFRDASKELTKTEYVRLLETARRQGNKSLELLMETICAAGIRVSETQHITVEAAEAGRAEIRLKGKIRTILLPGKLCRKLLKYAKKQKIASGEIFLTQSGAPITRHQIWQAMKSLCAASGVEASKVFPHNLRHLFARVFYQATRDIVKLADVLGHSSINTTRIYLRTTGAEHTRQLELLGLIC